MVRRRGTSKVYMVYLNNAPMARVVARTAGAAMSEFCTLNGLLARQRLTLGACGMNSHQCQVRMVNGIRACGRYKRCSMVSAVITNRGVVMAEGI